MLIFFSLSSGCVQNTSVTTNISNFSDLKKTVILDSDTIKKNSYLNGSRIIAGNSDVAELLITIGAGNSIVGITDPCLDDPEISAKLPGIPSIGDSATPSIEKIIQLKPDIYLTYSSYKPKNIDKILALNIRVMMIDCYKLEHLTNDAYLLGEITGKRDEALKYINFNRKYANIVSTRLSNLPYDDIISIYGESSDYIPMVQKSGGGQLIKALLARNVYGNNSIPEWPVVNSEWVLEKDPDFIIKNGVTEDSNVSLKKTYDSFLNRPGYRNLQACKTNRVFVINSEIVSSPKAILGLMYLAKVCYPNLFSDISPDKIKEEYISNFKFGKYLDECIYPEEYYPNDSEIT